MVFKLKQFLRYCAWCGVIGALAGWPVHVHSAVVVIGARPYLERVAKRVVEILEGRYISGNSLPIADYVAPIQITDKGLSISGNVSFHSAFLAKIESIEFDGQKFAEIFLNTEVSVQGALKWHGIGVVLDFEANLEEYQGTGTLYVTYNQFDFPLKVTKYFNATEPTGSLQFMSIDNSNRIVTVGYPNNKYVQLISRAMNLIGIVTVVVCLASGSSFAAPAPCEPAPLEDNVCDQTEYEAYRDCIEELKTTRHKRQALPCPPVIVAPVTQTEKPFEVLVPVNPLPILKEPQLKSLDRTVIVHPHDEEDEEENSVHYRVPVNVTTVIRLTNVVNNTNHIHMPAVVNSTNVNNIHVYANLTKPAKDDAKERCCTVVGPKSCQTTTEGVRCTRDRFKSCGPQCTSDVIHVQKRQRCTRATGECKEKIVYVPQPEKPTCVYVDDWPYVACGKLANMSVICAGCYDHYGYGYTAYNGHARIQDKCRGCYDDAFDMGPRYRRGPVLRPYYYHQPPCFLMGTCPTNYVDCGPEGCFGHDRIDPAWGAQPFEPALNPSNVLYYDPDDYQETNEESDDWGVPAEKCVVVTDGSTITIKNCTEGANNPYMAAPAFHPAFRPNKEKKSNTTKNPPTVTPTDDEDMEEESSGDALSTNNDVYFVEDDFYDDNF
uniref:Uncharacterized protein n=1 Tax=Anopheles epiroticus TaxID=199890 RepID=A0A182PUU1_9DIPT